MKLQELYNSFFDAGKRTEPYVDNSEHLAELSAFLDLCFAAVVSARGLDSEDLLKAHEAGSMTDLSVAADDVERILAPGRTAWLSDEALLQISAARGHIRDRVSLSIDADNIPRFEVLRIRFGLDDFESFVMLLALAAEYDRKYEGVYAWLHNNRSDICATKWLAVRLYECLFGELPQSRTAVLTDESPLCRFLCTRELERRDRSESAGRLILSRRVTSYLLGTNSPDPSLSRYCEHIVFDRDSYIPFREEKMRQLLYLLLKKGFREHGCFIAELYGPEGVGRTVMAGRAATAVQCTLLKIRLNELLRENKAEISKRLDMIYTETVLLGAIPCFVREIADTHRYSDDEAPAAVRSDEAPYAARIVASLFRFAFWLTNEKDSVFADTGAEVFSMELPMLTANERRIFWQAELPDTDLDTSSFSNRYILTPQTIRKSASLARVLAASEGKPLSQEHITAAVRQHSRDQLGSHAVKINAVFTWDDLIIGDEQKRCMKMICDQVKYRSVVNEDWGFRKKSPYGRGLCALFYGSPGTGKTMAVQVMANELGLDLYRIDLSQLTSKYIGETQKNISRLFDKAKNINAMLFFDEADSMFAKRSEVKDAHDRYANADTAFLLQKLEDFEGITILATNYVNNIDDAFKRRIKFMINFVFPTPEVRLTLWKTILPETARCDEELDFEFYAERFELSGSNIKEILTNAAYIAASQGSGIRNCHIIEAIKLNFSKYGKILTNADFEYLGA